MAEEVTDVLGEVQRIADKAKDHRHLSLESMTLLITSHRLHKLESDSRRELSELRERQKKVTFLHKLTKTLHSATTSKGELDHSQLPPDQLKEVKEMMKHAKELGVALNEEKLKYNNEERERLIENIRMTIEDHNIENEMQLQLITRLTNERYEAYQMANRILKPIHDAKINQTRHMGPPR